MKAKEDLMAARRAVVAAEAKRERIAQLRAIAESTGRPTDAGPVGGGGGRDRMAIVDLMVDFQRELAVEAEAMVALQRRATGLIMRLARVEQRTVLELYYLHGLTFDEVAERMGYSPRNVYYIHRKALEKIEGQGS